VFLSVLLCAVNAFCCLYGEIKIIIKTKKLCRCRAEGRRDAPQIRNIALENACNGMTSRTLKVITIAAITS